MNNPITEASEIPNVAGVPVGTEVVEQVKVSASSLKQVIANLREKAKTLTPLELVEFVPYLTTPEVLADKIAEKLSLDLEPIKQYMIQFPEKFSSLSVSSIISLVEEMEALSE